MEINKITQRFLDTEGRVAQLPVKVSKLQLVLEYLWEKFTVGSTYTEKQVNAILEQWSTLDYASVRREMVDHGFLCRELNGSAYWVEESLPEAQCGNRRTYA